MRMLFSQHVEGVWKRGGGGRRRQRRGPTSPFSEVPEEATIDAGSHASSSGEGMYTWAPALGSAPSAASAAIVLRLGSGSLSDTGHRTNRPRAHLLVARSAGGVFAPSKLKKRLLSGRANYTPHGPTLGGESKHVSLQITSI